MYQSHKRLSNIGDKEPPHFSAVGDKEKRSHADRDAAPQSYLRQSQIVGAGKLLPVAPSTFRRWIVAGLLPQPTKLSPGVSVWKASDIEAFIAQAGGSL